MVSTRSGKIVKMSTLKVMFHRGRSHESREPEMPRLNVMASRTARREPPPRSARREPNETRNRSGTSGAVGEFEQVSRPGWPQRTHHYAPVRARNWSTTRAPISSWTQSSSGSVDGRGSQNQPPQGLSGLLRSVDTGEGHQVAACCAGRAEEHLQRSPGRSEAADPGSTTLKPVRHQRDGYLAAGAVGPPDAADLQQSADWKLRVRRGRDRPLQSPEGSVDELDLDVDIVARSGGAHEGAYGVRHPAPLAYHPAHLALRDTDVEAHRRRAGRPSSR